MNKTPITLHESHHSVPSMMSIESVSSDSPLEGRTGMKRRLEGVSRRHIITCHTNIRKDFEIEGGKSLKRRAMRRYAITKYSQIPLNYMKSLRKKVDSVDDNRYFEKQTSETFQADDNDDEQQLKLVVFGLQDRLDTEKPGSQYFLNLISMYYSEKYQFADSDTHRSILRSIVLDEMKANGYKFVMKDLLRPNHYYVLDDLHVIKLIQAQFSLEKLKKAYYANSA